MNLEQMKELPKGEQEKLFKSIDFQRHKGKTTNYSATYGAGGATIAAAADITKEAGEELHTAYWDVNWALKAVASEQIIKFFYKDSKGSLTFKLMHGSDLIPQKEDSWKTKTKKYDLAKKAVEMWLWNPVSRFWYSLRFPKDIFSTLNQGTGVFCFDMWIKKFREKRDQLTGQMHDEIIAELKVGYRVQYEKMLRDSIQEVNEELKLNRDLDIDVQYGKTYAEIH